MNKVKSHATKNITFLPYQSKEDLKHYLQKARAFVFAAKEDFGITIVEAQACGTPVIAFGEGGARETVSDNINGILYKKQTVSDLISGVKRFLHAEGKFDARVVRDSTRPFCKREFRRNFSELIVKELSRKAKG